MIIKLKQIIKERYVLYYYKLNIFYMILFLWVIINSHKVFDKISDWKIIGVRWFEELSLLTWTFKCTK